MDTIIEIKVYHPQVDQGGAIYVTQISSNIYRAEENELFLELTKGTEFETETDENGTHNIVRITKASEYITETFLLSLEISDAEYKTIGDKIVQEGGHWQVDFGGIAIVNLPKDSTLNVNELIQDLRR